MNHLVNGVEVAMTPEEEAAFIASLPAQSSPATPPPPVPSLWLANLHVEDGEVTGVNGDTGLAMAFATGPGVLLALFSEETGDLNYGWNVSSTSGAANVTSRDTSYIEITVADAVEPYDLSVQIYRLIQG